MGVPPETPTGPFAHYPVAPALVTAAADDTFATAAPLREAGQAAVRSAIAADIETEGILQGLIGALGNRAAVPFTECTEAAVLCAGAVTRWSEAIGTFNSGVDGLNAEYAAASVTSFGVGGFTPEPGATAAETDTAEQQHAGRVSDARSALMGDLQIRYGRLESTLDGQATSVAGLLDRGPSEQAILTLFSAGSLPLDVRSLLPGFAWLDTERGRDAAVDDALEALEDDDRLDGEPGEYYRAWVEGMVAAGMSLQQIRDRAEQEDVDDDTFDDLDDLEILVDPDGRYFAMLEDDEGAKDIARLIELLNGGEPSETDTRRSNNEWTYDGFLISDSDVEFVLNNGGAIVATPEGTLMAAGGGEAFGFIPNPADWFSSRGGTTWMEMFVINGSYDNPEERLREIVEAGELNGTDLADLLRHERIHTEQWAEYGYWGFIARYLAEGTDPCENSFEEDAGYEDGGYSCN